MADKGWRPPDWKNLFNPAAIIVRDRNNKPISHYEAYEEGADAMLEDCRKHWEELVPDGCVCMAKESYRLATGVRGD